VRTSQEYGEGHLKGAVLIPVDELAARLNELPKAKEILVYCRTGNRSRTAINLLTAAGYQKLFHLKDGITTWIQQKYPVDK
jgi:phage shock protein E